MKIVAFLQNQWFFNPERAKRIYRELGPERRAELNARYLFAGCLSGKLLKKAFGPLCDRIIWENVSDEIGGHAAAAFPADMAHIDRVIKAYQPKVVLVFGKIAVEGMDKYINTLTYQNFINFNGPHPAARHATKMQELRNMATSLNRIISRQSAPVRQGKVDPTVSDVS